LIRSPGVKGTLYDLAGTLLGLVLVAAVLWPSYLVSIRLFGREALSVRCAALLLVAFGWLTASFALLMALRAFSVAVAMPGHFACAVAAHLWLGGRAGLRALAADVDRARSALARLAPTHVGPVALAAIVVVTLRIHRGLVAPPLAWDALTYHLFRAGEWIQHHGHVAPQGPGAWRYYAHFPDVGDLVWAWAMLPVRGDMLLAPAGLMVWASCLCAVFAWARVIGAAEVPAALAALAIGLTPAVVNLITTAYVDTTTLCLFALAAVFLCRTLRAPTPRDAVFAALGFGLVAGTKATGFVPLSLALVLVGFQVLRMPAPWRTRLATVAISAAVVVVALEGAVRAWVDTGSPFYPNDVSIGGFAPFPADEEWKLLCTGKLFGDSPQPVGAGDLVPLFFFGGLTGRNEPLGLGPLAPIVIGLGLWGGLRRFRERRDRLFLAFFLASAALTVFGVFSERMLGQRIHFWVFVIPRYLTPVFASFAVLAATLTVRGASPPRHPPGTRLIELRSSVETNPRSCPEEQSSMSLDVARAVWVLVALVGFHLRMPRGFGGADLAAMASLAPALAGPALLVGGLVVWRRRVGSGAGAAAVAGALSLVVFVACAASRIRPISRYAIYADAGTDPPSAYDMHPLGYAAAWPIWKELDDGAPHRIAVTAGWDGSGHNAYLYPLLGSRLQNRLSYVPVRADGRVQSPRLAAELLAAADPEAWLHRLAARRIEFLVVLGPPPLEAGWVSRHPDTFTEVARSADGSSRAYRIELRSEPP